MFATTAPVYADVPFSATELNRRSGKVLDAAVSSPVTIVRNDQFFALTSREFMSDMSRSVACLKESLAVLFAISRILSGEQLAENDQYYWLHMFTSKDLQDFSDEILQAAKGMPDVEELGNVLYEWRQSGLSVLNGSAKPTEQILENLGKQEDARAVGAK